MAFEVKFLEYIVISRDSIAIGYRDRIEDEKMNSACYFVSDLKKDLARYNLFMENLDKLAELMSNGSNPGFVFYSEDPGMIYPAT